jgi:ubiquinone/menaquinone biosynthesis C-methylase UbiE
VDIGISNTSKGCLRSRSQTPFFISAINQFVANQFPNGGIALDLAGGIGRHALWLAKKNWQVAVLDISEVAILKLAHTARQLDLPLNLFALDASDYPFEHDQFDLIVIMIRCQILIADESILLAITVVG